MAMEHIYSDKLVSNIGFKNLMSDIHDRISNVGVNWCVKPMVFELENFSGFE